MRITVNLFLLILFIFGFACTCGKKDDIVVYKVVSPPKPLYDSEKYVLVDTNISLSKLKTQAYTTDDVHQRILIFDYLLVYHPREADLGEFFKHYEDSDKTDWQGTREMELITASISQNHYTAIKEQCLYYITWYYVLNTHVDSIIMWMDSLYFLYPNSRLFNNYRYNLLLETSHEINNIAKNKALTEPERIWRLGNAYWQLATSEFKSPLGPFKKKAHAFFDTLTEEYPKSPFNANVRYVMISDDYDMETDGYVDTDHELQLANHLEQLLEKYPNTDIRDEMMLRIAFKYLIVTNVKMKTQPDTASFYYRKADSLHKLINFKYLETAQVDKRIQYIIKSTNKYIEEYQQIFSNQ